jgi:hypothetical protein
MPLMMISFICSCRNKIGVTMRMSGGRNALCNGDHGYRRHKRKSNWIYIQNNNSSWLGWSRTIPTSLHYITLALPAPKTAQPRREPQTHSKTIANKELRAHTTHHPRERTITNNIQTHNKYPLHTINHTPNAHVMASPPTAPYFELLQDDCPPLRLHTLAQWIPGERGT